jgi:alpha-tubulin suppressor-like RCC1 family protein
MDLGGAVAVDVDVGSRNGCVLFDDGVVKCWGSSGEGVVGPVPFTTGDIADVEPLDLGEPATQVSTDGGHACAILESGYIKCWGDNEYGQLGYGDTVDRGIDPSDWGDNLPYVSLF